MGQIKFATSVVTHKRSRQNRTQRFTSLFSRPTPDNGALPSNRLENSDLKYKLKAFQVTKGLKNPAVDTPYIIKCQQTVIFEVLKAMILGLNAV
jgi:hypothetical protein